MTDSLDRFLQDLQFDLPAGLVDRAKHAGAASGQTTLYYSPQAIKAETQDPVQPEKQVTPPIRKTRLGGDVHNYGQRRPPKILALVAALIAFAIVGTLVLTARSLHPRQVAPANPVVPANPIPLPKSGALTPGSYIVSNPDPVCAGGCSAYRWIYFTLPAGWATSNGLVYKHLGQPDEVAFSFWTVDQVYSDPCHWQGSALTPLDINHLSYDAATRRYFLLPYQGGLANQALRGPLPRVLTQMTVADVDAAGASYVTLAWRIDLSVPADLDISTCDQRQFRSWSEWHVADGANSHNAPGQLDTVYMVSVDRRPLVIDASHMPASSKADQAELKGIVASMVIDRG